MPGTEPVFVLSADQPGPALLRFLLDAHPELACPPETRLAALCAQLTGVWSQLEGSPPPADQPADQVSGLPAIPDVALAGIRHTVNRMIAPYLGRRGKQRYCDQSRGAAEHADVLRAVFPDAKFLCLYRHPMGVIGSGLEASPWGLNGPGSDSYADPSPRNTVLALAQLWAANVALIMAVEERFHECSHRVRYEDLVADPEGVGDRIFRFLGVAPVPGLAQACLTAEREQVGPSGHPAWPSARAGSGSVGGGWSIPAAMIGSPLTETINVLTDKLGYPRIDAHWGITALSGPRRPGGGPAAPDWQSSGPVPPQRQGSRPAAAQEPGGPSAVEPRRGARPEAQRPGSRPAMRPDPRPAAERPASGEQTPPGLRLVVAHLLSGLAGIDDRFARRWEPASQETFLVTVTSADTGEVVARWRVDLRARTITSADGIPAGATTGARWEVAGTIDVWMRVAEGEIDLSLALRRRLIRYRDTGESASVMLNRVAMLAGLLSITTWQRVQPPRPRTERAPGQGPPPPRRERAAPGGGPRPMHADGRARAGRPARERGAPEFAGPPEDETHIAWLPPTGHDGAQARRGW